MRHFPVIAVTNNFRQPHLMLPNQSIIIKQRGLQPLSYIRYKRVMNQVNTTKYLVFSKSNIWEPRHVTVNEYLWLDWS